jgi:hypothetical protein
VLPPRLVRRVVLAPLAIVIAIALVVLFPLLALLALAFSLVRRSGTGRMRGVRLLFFALVWLTAETATLFMCLGLWLASGFGGRMHTEPFQSRHYAIMRWFLDLIYRTATSSSGCGSRSRNRCSPPRSRRPGWPARSSCSAATPAQAIHCCWSATC